jgi:transcriptional regulator PpsR
MSRRYLQPADLHALATCAPDLAQVFVSLSSDIALVIDEQGVVLSVAQDPNAPMSALAEGWVGQRWADTVTEGTRRKIEKLLGDVHSTGLGRRREVNHAAESGGDIPVAYTALRLGARGPVLAVGRDLRTVSAIQQRFLNTQQDIERGYWRSRQSETRHRLLLQVATDAVLTVDAHTLCILEGNGAAVQLLQVGELPLAGRVAEQQFEAHARPAVRELLLRARSSGQPVEIQARLAGTHLSVGLLALPLRTAGGHRLLLRARTAEPIASDAQPLEAALSRLVESTRDGIVVTDMSGQVLGANRSFVRMAQASDEEQVRGRRLTEWLGPTEADVTALLCAVRDSGLAQDVALVLRGAPAAPPGPLHTQAQALAVTGMLLIEGDQECLGFIVRPQLPGHKTAARVAPVSLPVGPAIEALAGELGRTPLAELVRRAEKLARHHLVQHALDLTATDAAAALLLCVSAAQLAQLKNELALEAAARRP